MLTFATTDLFSLTFNIMTSMRKILLFLLLISSISTFAQKPFECDTVIVCPGLTADKIYSKFKYFVADNYRSAQNVIQLDDKDEHHLLCKGNIRFEVKNLTWHMLDGVINFTLDLQAKDGKARIIMRDFSHENFDRKFGDAWCMGPVYDQVPEGFKKGKRSYKEMIKRATPLIIDNMAMILAKLEVGLNKQSEESDW